MRLWVVQDCLRLLAPGPAEMALSAPTAQHPMHRCCVPPASLVRAALRRHVRLVHTMRCKGSPRPPSRVPRVPRITTPMAQLVTTMRGVCLVQSLSGRLPEQ